MSSRRSPPKGNLGGFCFDVLADARAVGAAVLDAELVRVEAGRQDARDVDPPHVRLHGGGVVLGRTGGLPTSQPTTRTNLRTARYPRDPAPPRADRGHTRA